MARFLVSRRKIVLLMLMVIAGCPALLNAQTTRANPQTPTIIPDITEPIYAAIPFVILVLAHTLLAALPWTRKAYNHFGTRLLIASAAIVCVMGYYWWRKSAPAAASSLSCLDTLDIPAFISFIVILGSLYIMAGNIRWHSTLKPTPWVNVMLLALGVFLAGFIGNIPVAMMLIFPLLEINLRRKYNQHTIIFFIVCVANTGGALLPAGDAALLYPYVHTASLPNMLPHLWRLWLMVNVALLVIYLIVDSLFWRLEKDRLSVQTSLHPQMLPAPTGRHNIFWLILAVVIIVLKNVNFSKIPNAYIPQPPHYFFEVLLLVLVALSLLTTPKDIRRENLFAKGILAEAAIFYLALFITAGPAREVLRSIISPERFSAPWRMFWLSGAFSSVADNTAVFSTLGTALAPAKSESAIITQSLIASAVIFFGALTYVGNGANYMIKTLAERAGIKMPGFFGYFFWSALILLPVLVALTMVQCWFFGSWAA